MQKHKEMTTKHQVTWTALQAQIGAMEEKCCCCKPNCLNFPSELDGYEG